MKGRELTLADGETIFREGEPSLDIYQIVEGQVKLTKLGKGGDVKLAILEAGDILGEMGVLDDSPRSATAAAAGAVTVRVVGREVFFHALHEEPGLAVSIMEKLVQRLRHMDDLSAAMGWEGGETQAGRGEAEQGWYPPGFLGQFLGLKKKRPASQETFNVLVSSLFGGQGAKISRNLAKTLDDAPGIRASYFHKRPLLSKKKDHLVQLVDARVQAMHWMAGEKADLFVWGDVIGDGELLHLYFIPNHLGEDDRPGAFGLATYLNLPSRGGPGEAELLTAVVLAVIRPKTALQLQRLSEVLAPPVEMASSLGLNPPASMDDRAKASVRACFGNACAITGHSSGGTQWYRMAIKAYRAALATLSRREAPVEWALTQKQTGHVLLAIGERSKDEDTLGEAVEALERALEVFTRERFPIDYASTQNTLGQALIKLARRSGEVRYLSQAVEAFTSALMIFDRQETPQHWAGAKHNLGQALQLLGARTEDMDLLREAVKACREALAAMKTLGDPLLKASAYNNLGSALFLYGKLGDSSKQLGYAVKSFDYAQKIYRFRKLVSMVNVVARNKAKARQLMEKMQGGAPGKP